MNLVPAADTKWVLVKGRAGLGNRIPSVLTGLLFARVTGRRLFVDWCDPIYSHDGSNVFHRMFECSLTSPDDELPQTDSVSPPVWRGHLHETARSVERQFAERETPENWRTFSFDFNRVDHGEDVIVMWTFAEQIGALRGHYRGELEPFEELSDDAILAALLREDVRLRPEIRRRVDEYKDRRFSRPTVGVHVRYSDHRVNLWGIFRRLDKLLREHPRLQVFLATDNVQIKYVFEQEYPGVMTTEHWYPEPGYVAHGGRGCPDKLAEGIAALVDLYLLAECDFLVVDSSSSFGRIATLLSRSPSENIYDEMIMHKQRRSVRRFTLRAWRKLRIFAWGPGVVRQASKLDGLFAR